MDEKTRIKHATAVAELDRINRMVAGGMSIRFAEWLVVHDLVSVYEQEFGPIPLVDTRPDRVFRITGKCSNESVDIKAPDENEAVEMFTHRFGVNPRHVACECCGPAFEITEVL